MASLRHNLKSILKSLTLSMGNPVLLQTLLVILIVEFFLWLLFNYSIIGSNPILTFEPKTGIIVFATIPPLLIGVINLRSSVALQKAMFIKDFVTKLHTDKELSQAFHYLIYTYSDSEYLAFKKATLSEQRIMQGERTEGNRLFDIDKFQGSEEERRFDSLLGYFDIVAYHYVTGTLNIKEIAVILGYRLTFLSKRKVVTDYLATIPDYWNRVNSKNQSVSPFNYLGIMLSDFNQFNLEEQERIKLLNKKRKI